MRWAANATALAAGALFSGWSAWILEREAALHGARLHAETALRQHHEALAVARVALQELAAANAANADKACTPALKARLQRALAGRPHLQDLGLIDGARVVCLSAGPVVWPETLGPTRLHAGALALRPLPGGTTAERRAGMAAVLNDRPYVALLRAEGQAAPSAFTALPARTGVLLPAAATPQVHGAPAPQADTFFAPDGSANASRRDASGVIAQAQVPASAVYRNGWLAVGAAAPAGALLSLALLGAARLAWRRWRSFGGRVQRALKADEFYLVYQPIVEARSGRWMAFEALLRWRTLDGREETPDQFIPRAERHEVIRLITARVIDLLVADMQRLSVRFPGCCVSFNASSLDLESPAFADHLIGRLQASGIDATRVHIEITERILVRGPLARDSIKRLRDAGLRVHIDDFGTEFCGLGYLARGEFDGLKIDRVFVRNSLTDDSARTVTVHIIALARALGLNVVAEGVETLAQAEFLTQQGVDHLQGWLYAPAMPLATLLQTPKPAAPHPIPFPAPTPAPLAGQPVTPATVPAEAPSPALS